MEVNCEGCAGCCVDWRPLSPEPLDHERRGGRLPLDDAYNLVSLSREGIERFVDAGYGDALTPRLWAPGEGDERVTIDGHAVAAIEDRPVFVVGLRTAPKPVAPFGVAPHWLRACVFLDPATLQCRIHGDRLYPGECADYPGHNLALDRETECERVERVHGGSRLLDRDDPPTRHLRLGPGALGTKVFAHPEPARLEGVVERLVDGALRPADRATFVGAAVGSRPGSIAVEDNRAATARERVLDASSWVGAAVDAWADRAGRTADTGSPGEGDGDAGAGLVVDADVDVEAEARTVEEARGAPPTPGWDRSADGDGGKD